MGSATLRRLWLGGMLATPLGCTFGTDGEGGAVDLQEMEDSSAASESSASAAGTTDNPTTAATDSQGGSTATGETTQSAGDSSGSPGTPRADLVFVDAEPIDLGTQPLAGPEAITLELTNQGEAAGQILGAEDPPAPLLWSGGTFPGIEGTCGGGPLPPGATCTVQLAVGAGYPGLVGGSLEVRYDDFEGIGSARADITMRASGRGPNLVVNPDAETGNLTGWTPGSGAFETSGEHNHESGGSRSFYGSDAALSEMSQDILVDEWAESIDNLPMVFHFSGWTRASSEFLDDDPHDIHLTFLDGAGVALDSRQNTNMTHDGWERTAWDVPVPATTRRVRVRLECDRDLGSNCSAWFDDFVGALGYEP